MGINLTQAIEILANISVLAGIIFLAFEIRQNTESVRATAAATFLQRSSDMAASVFSDREFAELWAKGNDEFDALDEIDQRRLFFFESVAIRTWSQNLILKERGLLPQEEWDRTLWEMRFILPRRQATQASWALAKESFPEKFQTLVDSFIRSN